MTKTTPLDKQERQLLKRIQNPDYLASLGVIRIAVEDIWRPEIRLIKGYTDHGFAHCQRIAEYANKLVLTDSVGS